MIDELIARSRQTRKRLLVVGDSMRDVWIEGRLEGCQDHCPKFVETDRHELPGGAGNAASLLTNWNAIVRLCSGTGQYPIKKRYVADGKIVWRHDYEALQQFTEQDRLDAFNELHTNEWDAVLISDYDKAFMDESFIRAVIDECRERKIPCVADAKREPRLYEGAIIKGNSDYFDKYAEKARRQNSQAVTTLGQYAPIVWDCGKATARGVNRSTVCRNHVGAGDCFSVHLIFALSHGLSLEDTATIAHSAGRVYVQKPYSCPPWPHEIRKDLQPVLGKIVDSDAIGAIGQASEDVVFANGCFDLLGPHHIYYLQTAKKEGKTLVVGLNDDNSVRRLKGPKRPLLNLEQRASMLASLECVDWVVPFSQDTPAELLKILQPSVLVKADDPDRNSAGDEYAKRVVLIPPMKGCSTTETMNRIQGRTGLSPTHISESTECAG